MRTALVAVLALAGCQDQSGTIELGLITAPSSTIIDGIEKLRVTITEPRETFEAVRTSSGFDLVIEVDATGGPGQLVLEGFDASDRLVATGTSPPFAVNAIDAKILVYLAPPMSIEPAPVVLSPTRERSAAGSLSYGAILVGGRDPTSLAAIDSVIVYNAYLHSVVAGLPLPAARSGTALAVGGNDSVYMFGGRDASGAPTGTLWRFDTTIPPNGAYSVIADEAGYARSEATMVPLGTDRFLVTGAPILDVGTTMILTRSDLAALPTGGAGVVGTDGIQTAVFAGPAGITRFRDNAFGSLSADPHTDARAVTLPDRSILVAGGGAGAVRVDVVTGELTSVTLLPVACAAPEMVATIRHVLISCAGMTHVLDAGDLTLLTSIPSSGTSLAALPNGQVLMLRGAELALFTPDSPL